MTGNGACKPPPDVAGEGGSLGGPPNGRAGQPRLNGATSGLVPLAKVAWIVTLRVASSTTESRAGMRPTLRSRTTCRIAQLLAARTAVMSLS